MSLTSISSSLFTQWQVTNNSLEDFPVKMEKARILIQQSKLRGLSSEETNQVKDLAIAFHSYRAKDIKKAREGLISLLSLSNESIQLMVTETLIPLFDISTIQYDLEYKEIESFIDHETSIYSILEKIMCLNHSELLGDSLCTLYENVLEHLWLLTHLDERGQIINLESQIFIERGEKIAFSFPKFSKSIECQLKRFRQDLSIQTKEKLKELRPLFQSDRYLTLRCRVGDLYFSWEEPQRALYHYERALSFAQIWESFKFEIPLDLKASIHLGREKVYKIIGNDVESKKASYLALEALDRLIEDIKTEEKIDTLDLPDRISTLIQSVQQKKILLSRATSKARELIENLKKVDISEARKSLVQMLYFPNEWIQKEVLEILSSSLDIQKLSYDVDTDQSKQLLKLEAELSQLIRDYLNQDKPNKMLLSLIYIYQNVLERLWLLSYLVKSGQIYSLIAEQNGPTILKQSRQWIDLLINEKGKNEELKIAALSVQKGIERIIISTSQPIVRKIEKLGLILFDLPLVMGFLGHIYIEINDFYRSIYYFEMCLKFIDFNLHKKCLPSIYFDLGSAYFSLGRDHEAIEFHKKNLNLIQDMGNCAYNKGEIYSALGHIYNKLKKYQKAIAYYEKALAIAQENGDCNAEGMIYFNLGINSHRLEKYHKAIEHHKKALKILQHRADRRHEEKTYIELGRAYLCLADYHKTIDFCEKALKIAQEIGDCQDEEAYAILGGAYNSLGKYQKAIELHEKSLQITKETGNRIEEIDLYTALGNDYDSLGEYQKAIAYYEKALKVSQEIGNRASEDFVYGNLGIAYSNIGKYYKAIECYEKSLKIAQEFDNNYSSHKAMIYTNLGNAYSFLGEYSQAVESHKKSLKIAQEIRDRKGEGASYGNLGVAYRCLGEYHKAVESHEKSLKIAQDIGNHSGEGLACSNLGLAYHCLGEYAEAMKFHNQALKIAQEIRNPNIEGTIYSNLGYAYFSLEKYQEAAAFYQKQAEIAYGLGNQTSLAQAHSNLGEVFLILGQYQKAIESHKHSLKISQKMGYRYGERVAYNNIAINYELLNDFPQAERYLRKSIVVCSSIQEELKDNSQWKITIFEEQSKTFLHLVVILLEQGKQEEALSMLDFGRSRALVDLLSNKLSLEISPTAVALSIEEIISIAKRQNTNFLVYSSNLFLNNKKKGCVWLISPNGEIIFKELNLDIIKENINEIEQVFKDFPFNQKRDRGTEELERTNVEEFAGVVRGRLSREERKKQLQKEIAEQRAKIIEEERTKFAQKLSFWYKALIEPIEEFLPKDLSQTLTIIPDGFLAQLPFAIFRDKNDKYLIEKYPLSIVPSIRTLDLLSRYSRQFSGKPLIIGNPDTGNPKDDLKHSEEEAKELRAVFKAEEKNVLTRTSASVHRVKEGMKEAQWIFFSCHGQAGKKPEYNPNSVFEGCLNLSPDEAHPNGYLHAEEIAKLDLNAELIVLSACYSGTGKIQNEGSIGHVWSFLGAGAQAVLATYWPLPDSKLTVQIVKEFTRYVLGEGVEKLNKVQALQKVMIEAIRENRDNPDQWGAFFLSGLMDYPLKLISTKNLYSSLIAREECFTRNKSVEFILEMTNLYDQKKMAAQLAELLQDLPPAIAQAVAYILETQISIEEYIEQFKQIKQKQGVIWKSENMPTDPSKVIIKISLSISLERIKEEEKRLIKNSKDHQVALHLIQMCSFLGAKKIPKKFFVEGGRKGIFNFKMDVLDLNQAFNLLSKFSLLNFKEEEIDVNSLVQSVIREELDSEISEKYLNQILNIFLYLIGNRDPEVAEVRKELAPLIFHMDLLIDHLENRYPTVNPEIFKFLDKVWAYQYYDGNYKESKRIAGLTLKIAETQKETLELGNSLNKFGMSLGELGDKNALNYLEQALQIRKKNLGEKHPDTATSYENVGRALKDLGKYKEALECQEQALKIRRENFGEKSFYVAESYLHIGSLLDELDKDEEALQYQMQALEIFEQSCGNRSHHLATIYNNLGMTLRKKGEYEKCLEYLIKSLEIDKKILRKKHPQIAYRYDNLSLILRDFKKYNEAIEYQKQAIEIFEETYGENHSETIIGYVNLSETLKDLGRYSEALKYKMHLIEIIKKYSEQNILIYPDIKFTIYNNTAMDLINLKRYNEALKFLKIALELAKKNLPNEHSNIINIYVNISLILEKIGKKEEALNYKNKIIQILYKKNPVDKELIKILENFSIKKLISLERKSLKKEETLYPIQKTQKGETIIFVDPSNYLHLQTDSFTTKILPIITTLFNKLDDLELTQYSKLQEINSFIEEIQKNWIKNIDPDLDGLFLNLFTRTTSLLARIKVSGSSKYLTGQRLSGTYNQFSPKKREGTLWSQDASRSSCTVNALMFLSYILPLPTVSAWESQCSKAESSSNKINEILDEGRNRFEQIVKKKRQGYAEVLTEATAMEEKQMVESLKLQYGGDALHVSEVPNLEETFFLTQERGLETLSLTRDSGSSETTIEFFNAFLHKIKAFLEISSLQTLGTIIQCNGYSYGLALIKNKEKIEFAVFDSHGCYRLNGHSNAFIYWTESLDEAAIFLGNLIEYQDLSLGFLSSEAKEPLIKDHQIVSLNQLAAYLFKPRSFH